MEALLLVCDLQVGVPRCVASVEAPSVELGASEEGLRHVVG